MANPDSISNLFGHYGDVMKVKVLHNKKDCALIQMSKPHQAALCRQFLDQQKIDNNTLCVSFSRIQGNLFKEIIFRSLLLTIPEGQAKNQSLS